MCSCNSCSRRNGLHDVIKQCPCMSKGEDGPTQKNHLHIKTFERVLCVSSVLHPLPDMHGVCNIS